MQRPRVWPWVVFALAPILAAAIYLFGFAADQYVVRAAFSVRSADGEMNANVLGGLSGLSGGTFTEAAMAQDYLESLDLVAALRADHGLGAMAADSDPLYPTPELTEDWARRWASMTQAQLDSRTGIVSFQVRAFSADGAGALALAALDATSDRIAALSARMRDDMVHHALAQYESAVHTSRDARQALAVFRIEVNTLTPELDMELQAGLLSQLHAQLAEAQIALALLGQSTTAQDARVQQAQAKVDAIENLIEMEQAKIRGNGAGDAHVAARFHALQTDLDYAVLAEGHARTAYDAALAAADRRGFYLAVHMQPQTPEKPLYPRRWVILGYVALLSILGVATVAMIVGGMRGRM